MKNFTSAEGTSKIFSLLTSATESNFQYLRVYLAGISLSGCNKQSRLFHKIKIKWYASDEKKL